MAGSPQSTEEEWTLQRPCDTRLLWRGWGCPALLSQPQRTYCKALPSKALPKRVLTFRILFRVWLCLLRELNLSKGGETLLLYHITRSPGPADVGTFPTEVGTVRQLIALWACLKIYHLNKVLPMFSFLSIIFMLRVILVLCLFIYIGCLLKVM